MAKKVKTVHQPFESNTQRGPFAKIALDMMASSAWLALSPRQHGLYLRLKSKYRQNMQAGVMVSNNIDNISLPTSEAKKLYGDLRTFRADIDKLIECGFIYLVQSGVNLRKPNIYGFSDRWKNYGKPDYTVPISERRQPHKWRPQNEQ